MVYFADGFVCLATGSHVQKKQTKPQFEWCRMALSISNDGPNQSSSSKRDGRFGHAAISAHDNRLFTERSEVWWPFCRPKNPVLAASIVAPKVPELREVFYAAAQTVSTFYLRVGVTLRLSLERWAKADLKSVSYCTNSAIRTSERIVDK